MKERTIMCLTLMKEEWDVAIILDACRYDTFKEVYKKYLPSGQLHKRIGASDTFDWLHSVFNGRKNNNLVYVSGHPGINGRNIAWGYFNATKKFYKVYDAWLSGWNWEIGTALPEEVTKIGIQARKTHPNRRLIIHFIQPHFPYRKAPCPSTYSDLKGVKKNPKLGFMLEKLFRELMSFSDLNFSRLRIAYWMFKKSFNLDFLQDLNEIYWRKYNPQRLKEFYRDNLEWALESISNFISRFGDDEIAVTSDHGEAFGEGGDFFHLYKTNNPVVRCVPYWSSKA
ncbi:MAG: hypothetical protein JSV05_03270 [Candidatus Bathyarchaeota archaeon]|nr:MAG: hypothetical protein JSV05_03270 [Candidatus Bathyarchaeota archaeon]